MEILFVGCAHALFIACFLGTKENKPLSDKLLAVWMLFLAMPLLARILSHYAMGQPWGRLNLPYPLLYGPFLYLYAESLVGDIQRIKLRHGWHFLPFLLAALAALFANQPPAFPHHGGGGPASVAMRLTGAAVVLSLLGYAGTVFWRLRRHYRDVLDQYSLLSRSLTLRWLSWVTLGFLFTSLLPIADTLVPLPRFLGTHSIAFTLFIFILSFYGLKQTQQVQSASHDEGRDQVPTSLASEGEISTSEADAPQPEERCEEDTGATSKHKYQRSGLDQASALKLVARLEAYMAQEKPYLEANITVEKLAKELAISRHYLTQIINEELGKNFYLFINEYRVEAVKALLKDVAKQDLTLLDMALQCGFNSKSTFNSVFKKITGMTPSQYKKS